MIKSHNNCSQLCKIELLLCDRWNVDRLNDCAFYFPDFQNTRSITYGQWTLTMIDVIGFLIRVSKNFFTNLGELFVEKWFETWIFRETFMLINAYATECERFLLTLTIIWYNCQHLSDFHDFIVRLQLGLRKVRWFSRCNNDKDTNKGNVADGI